MSIVVYIRAVIQTLIILGALGLLVSSGLYFILSIIRNAVTMISKMKNDSRVVTFLYRKIFNEDSYRAIYVFLLFCALVFLVLFLLSVIIFAIGYATKAF